MDVRSDSELGSQGRARLGTVSARCKGMEKHLGHTDRSPVLIIMLCGLERVQSSWQVGHWCCLLETPGQRGKAEHTWLVLSQCQVRVIPVLDGGLFLMTRLLVAVGTRADRLGSIAGGTGSHFDLMTECR